MEKFTIPVMVDSLKSPIATFHTTKIIVTDPTKFLFIGSIPESMYSYVSAESHIITEYKKLTPSGRGHSPLKCINLSMKLTSQRNGERRVIREMERRKANHLKLLRLRRQNQKKRLLLHRRGVRWRRWTRNWRLPPIVTLTMFIQIRSRRSQAKVTVLTKTVRIEEIFLLLLHLMRYQFMTRFHHLLLPQLTLQYRLLLHCVHHLSLHNQF